MWPCWPRVALEHMKCGRRDQDTASVIVFDFDQFKQTDRAVPGRRSPPWTWQLSPAPKVGIKMYTQQRHTQHLRVHVEDPLNEQGPWSPSTWPRKNCVLRAGPWPRTGCSLESLLAQHFRSKWGPLLKPQAVCLGSGLFGRKHPCSSPGRCHKLPESESHPMT